MEGYMLMGIHFALIAEFKTAAAGFGLAGSREGQLILRFGCVVCYTDCGIFQDEAVSAQLVQAVFCHFDSPPR